jgi:hypothetical protein
MSTKPVSMSAGESRFGLLQIGIVILTVLTAVIHLFLGFRFSDTLFLINGVGYLVLLAALFLPLPFAKDHRGLVRWALIGFAALTIIAWLIIAEKAWPQAALGYATKAIELVLIVLLLADRNRA